MTDKKYSDIDLDLEPHPLTGDILHKFDTEAVKRSIRNLVFIGKFDKPFHPEIQSKVRHSLFDNFSPITAFEIKKEIEEIIGLYEPRANVERVTVIQNDDYNRLEVTIEFKVQGIPTIQSLVVPIERIR
jgi:phage baseplate assembly protein W